MLWEEEGGRGQILKRLEGAMSVLCEGEKLKVTGV